MRQRADHGCDAASYREWRATAPQPRTEIEVDLDLPTQEDVEAEVAAKHNGDAVQGFPFEVEACAARLVEIMQAFEYPPSDPRALEYQALTLRLMHLGGIIGAHMQGGDHEPRPSMMALAALADADESP